MDATPGIMHSIARSILSINTSNLLEFASSLHFLPVSMTVVIAPAIYFNGHVMTSMCVLYAGLAVTTLMMWFAPILTLAPLIRLYPVSLTELVSTKEQGTGAGCPPMTLFSPARIPVDNVIRWLPFMEPGYLRGMAAHAHVPAFLMKDIGLTQLEAHSRAKPHTLFRKDGSQRPIFIHSHGLAGFARLYSTMLMTIAAQGAFVVAINHMDGSAAYCTDEERTVAVPLDSSLRWIYRDRKPQLDIRVEEARNVIKAVIDGSLLKQLGLSPAEVKRYVENDPQVVLVGHSFGGATVLAAAHEEEKKMRRGEPSLYRNIAGVIGHDPWCIPLWGRFVKPTETHGLPEGEELIKSFDEGEATYSVPTLLHHSQAWREDAQSWDFFTEFDARAHAQLAQEGLLLPEQRERIETATGRMATAMAPRAPPPAEAAPAAVAGAENSPASDAVETTTTAPDADADSEAFVPEDWFVTHTAMETGHLSYTDMALLSPVVYKKSYQTNRPEAPLHQWAHEAIRFAEVHVDKNMRL